MKLGYVSAPERAGGSRVRSSPPRPPFPRHFIFSNRRRANSLPFSVSSRWSRGPGGHLRSEALEGKQPCQGRAGGTYPWGEPRAAHPPGLFPSRCYLMWSRDRKEVHRRDGTKRKPPMPGPRRADSLAHEAWKVTDANAELTVFLDARGGRELAAVM